MRRDSFPAMGTKVVVVGETQTRLDSARALFDAIERRCSRFLPDSELSRINQGERRTLRVSPTMATALRIASELRDLTGGLVDAGVGHAVRAWGYDRTFSEVRDAEVAPALPGPHSWHVDGTTLSRDAQVEIDLGGIAKGWACDLVVEAGLAAIVSAGGDVRSSDPEAEVEVLDPWAEPAATVPLGIGALATSSVTRRRWRVSDGDAHHLIDPRTLAPAVSPVLSATVTASSAMHAEAGAKAVLLHGSGGLAWAAEQEWLTGALVVWHDGSVYATKNLEVAA